MALKIDLDKPRARLEEVLFGGGGWDVPGTVEIYFDQHAAADDIFDTVTGTWTKLGNALVYRGPAAFRAADPERTVDVGADEQVRAEWTLKLPMSAPQPPPGGIVEILTCARDATLIGRRFRISRVLGSSFAIMRRAVMHEYVSMPNELP